MQVGIVLAVDSAKDIVTVRMHGRITTYSGYGAFVDPALRVGDQAQMGFLSDGRLAFAPPNPHV